MLTNLKPKFKKAMLISALTTVFSPLAHSESLIEMYNLALANDPSLKTQQSIFEAASDIVNIERSVSLPQIDGQVTYDSSHTDNDFVQDSSSDILGFSLSLRQSIINFQNHYLIERGQIDEQVAATQLAAAEQSLLLRTASAYFEVLNAFDQLRSAQTEQELLSNRLEQVQERFDVGLIPVNDVLEAQANVDTALAASIAADANLGVQRENLASITGRYTQTINPLSADFTAPAPKPDNREMWIDQALKGNLDLKVKTLIVDAANFSHKATVKSDAPKLDGSASVTHSRDLQFSDDSNTTRLGLQLSVPLYAGGRFSALKRQSAQQIVQAEEQLRMAQRNTTREARSLFLSLKSSQALLRARQQVIVSSQSALDASQAGYDAGIRDIIDVNNAQKNAFQAQRNYSTALYQYLVDSLRLKAAAGLLTVTDLEALDKALDSNAALTLSDFSVVN